MLKNTLHQVLKSAKILLAPQREVTTAVRTISTIRTSATIDESSEPSVEMDRLCPNSLDAMGNNKGGGGVGGLGSFRWVVDRLLILQSLLDILTRISDFVTHPKANYSTVALLPCDYLLVYLLDILTILQLSRGSHNIR